MNSTSAIKVRILFFAKTRELSGNSEAVLELESSKIFASELVDQICAKFNLEIIKRNIILAVNEDYCDNLQRELQLKEGDEIAVIPPISGG